MHPVLWHAVRPCRIREASRCDSGNLGSRPRLSAGSLRLRYGSALAETGTLLRCQSFVEPFCQAIDKALSQLKRVVEPAQS